jgi:catechol 2,3-dioxygenase-like lactoylglutathione lyase family enzyme
MISGGNATVYVGDMDRSVEFYTRTLGLVLHDRFENEWAAIDAGNGFLIGLQPARPDGPEPGVEGSMVVGLFVDQPLEEVHEEFFRRGVKFRGPIVNDQVVRLAYFTDPDGNLLYLCETNYKY